MQTLEETSFVYIFGFHDYLQIDLDENLHEICIV